MTKTPPAHLIDWQGKDWTPRLRRRKAAHPNARFTVASIAVPVARSARGTIPPGVPISRVHLRRAPLRHRAARVARRAPGKRASTRRRRWARRRRRPPPARSAKCAATRSRCCRSAATTSATISSTGSRWASAVAHPPRIFSVNWFRKDADGKFVWPGFGQNMRVLKWIVERCHGRAGAVETPLGWCPPTTTSTGPASTFPPSVSRRSCRWTRRSGSASSPSTTRCSQGRRQAASGAGGERAKLAQRLGGVSAHTGACRNLEGCDRRDHSPLFYIDVL